MNLVRAVSGYHLGASKKALLLIYKSLIRSVIDYGDVVYSSASKSMLDKLSSVQTEALRLYCGAAKGTAALALQNECGEMPLQNRRLQNSLKFGAKVLGTPQSGQLISLIGQMNSKQLQIRKSRFTH